MSKEERFKYYYNDRVKRHEVFDCYVNLPLSNKGIIKLLNDQQDKIADLEAKLAEKEKISFTVEVLEKLKGKIQHNILFADCEDCLNVIEEIDDQIEQLKEVK